MSAEAFNFLRVFGVGAFVGMLGFTVFVLVNELRGGRCEHGGSLRMHVAENDTAVVWCVKCGKVVSAYRIHRGIGK